MLDVYTPSEPARREEPSLLLYSTMFALVVVSMYLWGLNEARREAASRVYRATATVCHPTLDDAPASETAAGQLATRLATPEALAETARAMNLPIQNQVGEPRLDVAPTPDGGELAVTATSTADDPRQAVRLVNRLAEQYAKAWRAHCRRATAEAYTARKAEAAQADEALTAAIARRDTLEAQLRTARAEQPASMPAPRQPRVENPEWARLQRLLARLEERREALLVERTESHPQVRHTMLQIDDARRQLAFTPQLLGEAGQTVERPFAAIVSKASAREIARLRAELASAHDAVERAEAAAREAAQLRDQAWQTAQATPAFRLQQAELPPMLPPARPGWGWIGLAFLAGLAAVGGLRLIDLLTTKRTFRSVAEVRAQLDLPILGVIPRAA